MAESADRLEARRLIEQYAGRDEPTSAPAPIDVIGLLEKMGRRLSYAEDVALRDAHRLGIGAETEKALVDGGGVAAVEKLLSTRRADRVRGLQSKYGTARGAEVARLLEGRGR